MTVKMYDTPQPVEKYLNVPLECSCGRTHYAPIKAMKICSGAVNSLPQYVKDFGYQNPYILCDPITYRIVGEKCENLLKNAGFKDTKLHILKHTGYDEATLGEIVINKPEDCDLMIGCGTGSITDILRYSSYKLKLPCFTVVTGAPMDGFSASAGIMNVNNLKATMPAHSTELIIGDTDIISAAPYRMTVAGFGDLIGKLTALNDWRVAVLIHGDHYCEKMDALVTDCVDNIIAKSALIKAKDPQAIGEVMSSLILTGATISLYGTSRPISGAEHHMSHYWDALGDQRGKPFAMHGEQVAVATVVVLMVTEELAKAEIDFEKSLELAPLYDERKWQEEIRRAYGSAADAIIALDAKAQKNAAAGRIERIHMLQEHWDEVRAMLKGQRSSDWLRNLLADLGSPCCPKDIGVDKVLLRDTILYCKETRAVYTIYQMAWDLGILEDIADKVIERLEREQLI